MTAEFQAFKLITPEQTQFSIRSPVNINGLVSLTLSFAFAISTYPSAAAARCNRQPCVAVQLDTTIVMQWNM
jgi:hypothetical protein